MSPTLKRRKGGYVTALTRSSRYILIADGQWMPMLPEMPALRIMVSSLGNEDSNRLEAFWMDCSEQRSSCSVWKEIRESAERSNLVDFF